MRTKHLAWIIAFACMCVGVGIWAVLRRGSTPAAADGSALQPLRPQATEVGVGTPGLTPRDFGEQIRLAVHSAVSSLTKPASGADSLVTAVGDAAAMYATDNPDNFEAYCQAHNIQPLSATAPDPEYVSVMWSEFFAWFRTSIVDVGNITVRWRLQNGIDAGQHETSFVRTTSRDSARPFWLRLPESQRQSIEIVLPLVSEDLDRRIFESQLGLEFGYDPETSEWLLLRTRHYNVPNEHRVVEAPV